MAKKQVNALTKNTNYHNTVKMLKNYRDFKWSVYLSATQACEDFKTEYDMKIEEYLESIHAAGADFKGTNLDHHANTIMRSYKMIKMIDSAISLIRESHKYGERYFWILWYTYTCSHELSNTNEILDMLDGHIKNISPNAYFAYKREAIDLLSSILWGVTAPQYKEISEMFS